MNTCPDWPSPCQCDLGALIQDNVERRLQYEARLRTDLALDKIIPRCQAVSDSGVKCVMYLDANQVRHDRQDWLYQHLRSI